MKDIQMWNYGGVLVEDSKKLYLGMAISANLLFRYEYKYVQKYLYSAIQYFPYPRNFHLKISIMQLNITEDGLNLVTVKTYWLKIIQRHWKNTIKIKKEIIEEMKTYKYIQNRELGKDRYKIIPKLQGMLHKYKY